MMKIIGHATVLTFGENHQVVEDGAVAFDEKKIHAVGKTDELRKRFPMVKVKNARGKLITPGLINGHMHLYSTFARGISLKDPPAENFTQILETLWWKLDRALKPEDVEYSALIPLLGAIRGGVTSLIDHHSSPHALAGSLETLKKVFRKCGLRGCLCYEVSDRDGTSRKEAGIEENANFIRGLKLENEKDIAALFGLHASFTLEDTTLGRVAELVKGLKCGIHIHAAEDRADLDDARTRGYRSVIDRLHRFGFTGPDSIFAHCVHVDEIDLQTLALTRTNVVHNPRSNMNNAVGCANLEAMIHEKIPVALGTDGFSASPLEDLTVANILHKHQAKDPRKIYSEIWKVFSRNNPSLAHKLFKIPLGTLEEGAGSDLVIWNYDPPTPLTSTNTLGHLLFGLSTSTTQEVICQGKTVYEDGKFSFISEEEESEICAKSRELAKSLWERL
ncbi:MAG: putative aminohydrolase SsnA [Candidatus Riflebacteria bacterium]|nr:putative aminohydrolase SsnA [Candidatus Riflebacteria bacterium]